MIERDGGVYARETKLTVIGKMLNVGDNAPDFEGADNFFSPNMASFSESAGKVRLINVVPSLSTDVCDAQTRRFDQEVGSYGDDVVYYTVSVDLPIYQQNWCAGAGVENVKMLSDHRTMSFGTAYGTYVKELRCEQRAVFIVDAEDIIRYAEYVPQIGDHPNYDAALAALKEVVSQ